MLKVLFVCTHNRCRSILAEAITNHLGQGRIQACSAGSQSSGQIHPLSLQYLQESGFAVNKLQSQSWDEFEDWQPDIVVTVCDYAAGEACPFWMEKTPKVHWGLPDPSKLAGHRDEVKDAFLNVIHRLERRISLLLQHDIENLSADELQTVFFSLAEDRFI